jgi:hypothetical protein
MPQGRNWIIGIIFFILLIFLVIFFTLVPTLLIPDSQPETEPAPEPETGPEPTPQPDEKFLINQLEKTSVQTIITNGGTILPNLRRLVGQTFKNRDQESILNYVEINIQNNPFGTMDQTPLEMKIYKTDINHKPTDGPLRSKMVILNKGYDGVIRFEKLDVPLSPNIEYVAVFGCPDPPVNQEYAVRWYVSNPTQNPQYELVSSDGSAWQVSAESYLTMAVNIL